LLQAWPAFSSSLIASFFPSIQLDVKEAALPTSRSLHSFQSTKVYDIMPYAFSHMDYAHVYVAFDVLYR
jgi:hypothetical protein